jgi:hypothetical protein
MNFHWEWLFWPVLALIVIGLPTYFSHREKMARLRGKGREPEEKLLARIEALEKKCAQLQEQVNEAHILIHDEQRELDRKLAARLEEAGAIPSDSAAGAQARRGGASAEVRA